MVALEPEIYRGMGRRRGDLRWRRQGDPPWIRPAILSKILQAAGGGAHLGPGGHRVGAAASG